MSDSEDNDFHDSLPKYVYEDLPAARPVHHIRVLRFVRQSRGSSEELACELVKLDIAEKGEQYVAISWAWGNRNENATWKDIIIRQNNQDCLFRLPPTLAEALRTFRNSKELRKKGLRTFWVDLICINQQDDKEKSHQIPMMSEIYGRAHMVCVWLGEASEDSEMALDFIKNKLARLKDFDTLCKQSPNEWFAVLKFAQRDWFTRRWVIQEISIAQQATLFCGKQTIEWRDFADAIQLVLGSPSAMTNISTAIKEKKGLPDWYEGFETIGASLIVDAAFTMFRRSGNHIKTPVMPLEFLVSKLYIFDVTEPRDAIYSLLALARDVQASADNQQVRLRIPHVVNDWVKKSLKANYLVDYEQPYRSVCRDYVSFCVETADEARALDVICRPWAFAPKASEKDRIMPSWVPSRAGAAFKPYTHVNFEKKVHRKNADALVGLPSPAPRIYSAAGTLALRPKKVRFKTRDNYTSMYVTGFILDQVKAVRSEANFGNIPEEWLAACNWTSLERDPPDAFWRTLVGNRDNLGRNPPLYYKKACKETITHGTLAIGAVNTSDFIKESSSSVISDFYRRVQAVIYNRRLVNTRGGRICLAHKDVQVGDRICILYGCSVPVILRPSKKNSREMDEQLQADRRDEAEVLKRLFATFNTKERFRQRKRPKPATKITTDVPSPESLIQTDEIPNNTEPTPKSPPPVKKKPPGLRTQSPVGPDSNDLSKDTNAVPSIPPPLNIAASLQFVERRGSSGTLSPLPNVRERRPSFERERSREMLQAPEMQDLARWIEKEGQEGRDTEYWYKFCGECYLHGMMDGEAVEFKNDYEGVKRHYFELR